MSDAVGTVSKVRHRQRQLLAATMRRIGISVLLGSARADRAACFARSLEHVSPVPRVLRCRGDCLLVRAEIRACCGSHRCLYQLGGGGGNAWRWCHGRVAHRRSEHAIFQPALEASGHAYVQLTGTGQYVQWTNNTGQPITFINVRESIPDAPGGGGITATLNLYVNGVFRQALNLNSKQTWICEGNNNYQGNDQNPADGDPHVFFDESHTFITGVPIAPGSTFSLQKDAANSAAPRRPFRIAKPHS
jgi:hypothetical protein